MNTLAKTNPGGALERYSSTNSTNWANVAQAWLENFRSDRTRRTYAAAWRDFLKWYGMATPADVARLDVIHYRDELERGRAKSGATVAVRLAALASFFAYAQAEGLIATNPAAGVDRPKVAAYTAAKWLTTKEARELLRAPDRATLEGKRDYAILIAMLSMGLRRAELVGMTRGAIVANGDKAELRYTPKGGAEQTRTIPAQAWRAIRAYLDERGPLDDDAAIFVAHDRAAHGRESAISGEALRYIVAKYSKAALGRVINPHALRHTCAGVAWDSTRDLRRVQNLLGHASATTTERYLHRRDDDRGELGEAIARILEV